MTKAAFTLDITGMTCAACAHRLERVLACVPGVERAQIDLAQERALVQSEAAGVEEAAILAIRAAGYGAFSHGGSALMRKEQRVKREAQLQREDRITWARALLALVIALPFLVTMVLEVTSGASGHLLSPVVQLFLAGIVQSVCAWPFYGRAISALRAGSASMDVLVVVGTLAAFCLSLKHVLDGTAHHGAPLYFEGSVAVIAFVLLGKVIERMARREAGAALHALAQVMPERVTLLKDGIEQEIALDAATVGMTLVVKPGQVVPADGVILEGEAWFDESSLTGESLPLERKPGEAIHAGSGVSGGRITMEVRALRDETRLGRLARLIEDAGVKDAPAQSLVDRISQVFVPVVLGLAMMSGIAWLLAGVGAERAMVIAISVVVVACPCALGLATPIALVAGASAGARQGLIVVDHAALEAVATLTHIAFDKTGTLTQGRPSVMRIASLDGDGDRVLRLASALAARSDHPLDGAIIAAAKERGVLRGEVTDFAARSGYGLSGLIEGQAIRLGQLKHVDPDQSQTECVARLRKGLLPEERARPEAWLSVAGKIAALFVFGDPLRSESMEAVARLKGAGVTVVMLSGDHQDVVAANGLALGIEDVRAQLAPEAKVLALIALKEGGARVGFVGDGLNDGPALRESQVGIAMGTGTDVAKGAASVILARPDPRLAETFIRLGKETVKTIRQNLFLAFLFNCVAIPLAMAGLLSPVIAGAAMALSSVMVVLNAVRLSRWQPKRSNFLHSA